MDRGQSAVLPLLDEVVANQENHTQVIGVGPGFVRDTSFRSGSTSACRPARWPRWQPSHPHRMPTWCPACWRATVSFIWRRRSSCNCCQPCWRQRAERYSTAFRLTTYGSTLRRLARSLRTAAMPVPTSSPKCSAHGSVILLKDVDGGLSRPIRRCIPISDHSARSRRRIASYAAGDPSDRARGLAASDAR